MAARLHPQHQDRIRNLIQANRLAAMLNAFALGRKLHGQELKLSSDRIKVALALLNKRLPDLQAVQLSGDPDNPFMIEHELGGRAAALLAKVKGQGATGGAGG